MKEKNIEKLEAILNNISEEFPKISLENTINLEEFICNNILDEEIIKKLSIFLIEYDKKSIENNTKYGFPENDFENYKERDLFLCKSYKAIIENLEKNNKDESFIKKYVKIGAQKVHDRKLPYRCLTLGRLDYKETAADFKELIIFYTEKIKKYDKGCRFTESENTKAYNLSKKAKKENTIKLLIVTGIILAVFFIGRAIGRLVMTNFSKDQHSNTVQEEREIEII